MHVVTLLLKQKGGEISLHARVVDQVGEGAGVGVHHAVKYHALALKPGNLAEKPHAILSQRRFAQLPRFKLTASELRFLLKVVVETACGKVSFCAHRDAPFVGFVLKRCMSCTIMRQKTLI